MDGLASKPSHEFVSFNKGELAGLLHLVELLSEAILFAMFEVECTEGCNKVASELQRCMDVVQSLVWNVALREAAACSNDIVSVVVLCREFVKAHAEPLLKHFLIDACFF